MMYSSDIIGNIKSLVDKRPDFSTGVIMEIISYHTWFPEVKKDLVGLYLYIESYEEGSYSIRKSGNHITITIG